MTSQNLLAILEDILVSSTNILKDIVKVSDNMKVISKSYENVFDFLTV